MTTPANPQPDAREVARARKEIDTGFANGDEVSLIVARYGAERYAEGEAAERERAAKIADARVESFNADGGGVDTGRIWSSAMAREIGSAIRAGDAT